MKDNDIRDMMDKHEFFAELERVCPEARRGGVGDGLADVRSTAPSSLSHSELADILRTLPDNAGVDAVMRAWSAITPKLDERERETLA